MKTTFLSLFLIVLLSAGCGGGSSASGILISTASDTTVTSETSVLRVTAGSFEENLRVQIEETDATTEEVFENTVLSNKITYSFSKALGVVDGGSVTLTITLDAALLAQILGSDTPLYAQWRERGETTGIVEVEESDESDAGSFNAWQIVFGTLDEVAGTYTLTVPATAEDIDVVVVADEDLVMVVNEEAPASVSRAQNGAVSRAVNSLLTPWAIICVKDTFSADDKEKCNPDSPDYFLGDLLEELDNASVFLQALGWLEARTTQMTGAEIRALNLPADPAIDSLPDGDNTRFNIVYVMNRCPLARSVADGDNINFTNGRGATYPNGDICFRLNALDDAPQSEFGNVVAHELFHAIQGAYNPQMFRSNDIVNEYLWIIEGTATVMGFASQLGEGDDLLEKVFGGARRDWSFTLKDTSEFLNEYRAFEFFAFLNDGDVDYLTDFFLAMDESGSDLNSFVDADLATADLFNLTLAEAYTQRVMSQRGATSDNNDCTFLNITEDLEADDQVTLTRDYAGVPDETLTPISSLCFDIQYDNGDDHCMELTLTSPDGQQSLLVLGANVTGGDSNFAHRGKDGTVTGVGGTAIQIEGQSGDIRVIRDAYGRDIVEGTEWEINIEKVDCEENSLTGTWCASSDVNGAITPCEDYGSFIQITENEDDSLTGVGMLFVCELAYNIDTGIRNDDDVDISLTTVRSDNVFTDCENHVGSFDLSLTNSTTLTGTWDLNGQTENVILTKYSSDPDIVIPFYGVDNGI